MVICSFFLKGNCRYGNRCKDEHVYNSAHHSSVLKKNAEVDITVLINSVSQDAIKSEKGGQWPLSCYGPFQQKPCFPGFEDRCFEEIRMGYYEAQKNGTLEQYTQQLKQILEETRNKIHALQAPTPEITQIIHDIYHAKNSSVPVNSNGIFSNQNTFANPSAQQNPIFGNKSPNVFVNQPQTNQSNFTFSLPENKSIFNNTNVQQGFQSESSVFGKPQNTFTANQNIFTNRNVQPVQTGSLFQQTPSNTNIFGNATTTPVFGNTAPPTNVFGNQGASTANAFTNQVASTGNAFTNQVASTANNVFANQVTSTANNVFANPLATASQPNIFSSPAATANNVFGTPSQTNVFNNFNQPNPNVFTNSTQSNIFAQPVAKQSSTNIFATANSSLPFGQGQQQQQQQVQQQVQQQQPQPQPQPFSNQNSFSSPFQSTNTSNSPFATNAQSHSTNIFGNKPQTTNVHKTDDPTVYCRIEDLTSEDIVEYEKDKFTFGKIPTRAPAIGMC